MNKILILTVVAFLSTFSLGQELYKPFLEEGKVWTYHYYNDMTGREFYESLSVRGDTIIDNKSYKSISNVDTDAYCFALRAHEVGAESSPSPSNGKISPSFNPKS